jgi:hypothetical protein
MIALRRQLGRLQVCGQICGRSHGAWMKRGQMKLLQYVSVDVFVSDGESGGIVFGCARRSSRSETTKILARWLRKLSARYTKWLAMNDWKRCTPGAKALIFVGPLTARLKSGPDTKHQSGDSRKTRAFRANGSILLGYVSCPVVFRNFCESVRIVQKRTLAASCYIWMKMQQVESARCS